MAGLLLAGYLRADSLIRLKAGVVDPGRAASLARPSRATRHYLLQFSEPPGRQIREDLERRGIRVLSYVPDSALMVAASETADLEGLGARWVGSLETGDKLSPALASEGGSVYLVVFYPDADMAAAREAARAAGLDVLEHPDLLPQQLLLAGPYERVVALAESDEVSYVLPASPDLTAGNRVLACPGASTEFGAIAEYVKVGTGWPQDAAGGVSLGYVFASLTGKVDEATVRSEFARAFQEWAKYAKVNLAPGGTSGSPRTIAIQFSRGAHGDAYPFDGAGKVLAHTFYPSPPNAEPAAGDMHFDDDEDWHTGANLDLYTVALHEAGHALGLGHSDKPGALMYPYYRFGAAMSDDDIAGIRALYGARESQPPVVVVPAPEAPATSPSEPSGGPPDLPAVPSVPTPSQPSADAPVQTPSQPPLPPMTPSQPAEPTQPADGTTPTALPPVPPSPGDPSQPATPTTPAATPPATTPPATPPATTPPATTPTAPAPGGDVTAPSLRIVTPGFSIVSTSAASLKVAGTASDGVGVTAVKWTVSTGGSGTASGTTNWSATVPLLVGTNVITIRAYDAAGNSGWRAVTVERR